MNQAHLHAAKAFDPSFPPHRASPLPTFKDILIQREREETGWVGGERSAEKNTLSSFTGAAPEGEARRRPNSNFGRRLIFADNGQRIFPRRPFLLLRCFFHPSLLPYRSRPRQERKREPSRACVYVYTTECVHVSRGSVHMITGLPSPFLCVEHVGMCVSRHVCCLTYDASFHCPV